MLSVLIAVVLMICLTSCGSTDRAGVTADEAGSQQSIPSTSTTCKPDELPGLVVDNCKPTDNAIVSSLLDSLEEAYPGLYTEDQLECIGSNYLELSESQRASIASEVFNSASPAAEEADAAVGGPFTSCGTTSPPTT